MAGVLLEGCWCGILLPCLHLAHFKQNKQSPDCAVVGPYPRRSVDLAIPSAIPSDWYLGEEHIHPLFPLVDDKVESFLGQYATPISCALCDEPAKVMFWPSSGGKKAESLLP
jgi:hypothetical protein